MTVIYDIGDRRSLSCALTDSDGDPVDPTVLVFQMREPNGTLTAYTYGIDAEVVRDGPGEYRVEWDCAQAGTHYWRFAASGNVGAAEESLFLVRSSTVLGPGGAWPIDETCLPSLPSLSTPPTEEELAAYNSAEMSLAAAKDLAVQVLWALSGRQFGVWSTVARPCPQTYPGYRDGTWWPTSYEVYGWDYGWVLEGCGCIGSCIRSGPGMVHLPGPVHEVTAVYIDGTEIDASEYALEGDVLYRTGAGWWPRQDLSRPATDAGTWKVEYLCGIDPPAGTAKLVGLLAAEFYNACTDGKCRLPRTVTEMSRRGVSYRIPNPADIYTSGKTGLPEIDLFLSAVNPHHLLQAPVVG